MRRAALGDLVFLRGRDADRRLRELTSWRIRARPTLGALAVVFLERRCFESLGFRSLGDWSRERIGVGARVVREWARVWRALAELPRLRDAVLEGDVSWAVARRIVAHVTPETERAALETVRGRTVRAVEALLRVAFPRGGPVREDERVGVRVACSPAVSIKWSAALELARRVAGENLPAWECAEAIAAECASGLSTSDAARVPLRGARGAELGVGDDEDGRRARVWPELRWSCVRSGNRDELRDLVDGAEYCTKRELDRRLRWVISRLQRVDSEIARVLKQVVDRELYRELGFESFDRYVVERLDLSPRTARRLVRIARSEHTLPAVANAFRSGRITLLQAEVLLRGGCVERAERVTLRRLEDDVPLRRVEFAAPPEVAALFLGLVECVGLEAMLDHALATWLQVGEGFCDYADFERDGWRCTVPACSARRNLQSHHIRFRSAGGPDVPSNRTTLCAFHHHQGVHAGRLAIRGEAPEGLVYELGVGRFGSGDVKM